MQPLIYLLYYQEVYNLFSNRMHLLALPHLLEVLNPTLLNTVSAITTEVIKDLTVLMITSSILYIKLTLIKIDHITTRSPSKTAKLKQLKLLEICNL
jgi:hypothetical protein